MKIGKWLAMLFTVLLVSMFFFPFEFKGFLGQNTKNLMAALGLVFIFMTFIYKRSLVIPRELIILLFLAGGVSVVSYVAVVYNQTPDYSYVTYIRAAVIWLSAAYVGAIVIWLVHGYIDAKLVVNYLTAVCVFQCAMAMLIQFVPSVQMFVDAHVEQGQDLLKDLGRLYGIGASLDVAGSRFAVVLVAIAAVVDSELHEMKLSEIFIYGFAFIVITVIGNMIARTTIIGVALAVGLFLLRFAQSMMRRGGSFIGKLFGALTLVLVIIVPTAIVLYNTFPAFQELFRFGFESFFNLFEEGEFQSDSTEKLKSMIVFPEEMRTWIIGDGYFENSRNDINYLGNSTDQGYYMGTDIGYLRFIFYGGILMLLSISLVMIYAGIVCMKKFPDYKMVFILAISVNFIVWLKVATDIFLFFCIFICAFVVQETLGENDEEELEDEDEDDLLEEDDEEYDEDDEDASPEKVPVFRYPGFLKRG